MRLVERKALSHEEEEEDMMREEERVFCKKLKEKYVWNYYINLVLDESY